MRITYICIGLRLRLAHIQRGIDRTGEFAGAYELAFMYKSLSEAISLHVTNRMMMEENALALTWWCMHLAYVRDDGGLEVKAWLH